MDRLCTCQCSRQRPQRRTLRCLIRFRPTIPAALRSWLAGRSFRWLPKDWWLHWHCRLPIPHLSTCGVRNDETRDTSWTFELLECCHFSFRPMLTRRHLLIKVDLEELLHACLFPEEIQGLHGHQSSNNERVLS